MLLRKWMLGPVSGYDGGPNRTVGFRLTGGTALWGVLLYAGTFLAIRGLQVYAYRQWASHYQLPITTPDTSAPDSKCP